MSNFEVLEKIETERIITLNIRKNQLKFPRSIIRKEGLKHLALTEHIKGKGVRGKHHITYLTTLFTWMAE